MTDAPDQPTEPSAASDASAATDNPLHTAPRTLEEAKQAEELAANGPADADSDDQPTDREPLRGEGTDGAADDQDDQGDPTNPFLGVWPAPADLEYPDDATDDQQQQVVQNLEAITSSLRSVLRTALSGVNVEQNADYDPDAWADPEKVLSVAEEALQVYSAEQLVRLYLSVLSGLEYRSWKSKRALMRALDSDSSLRAFEVDLG